jgi:hypothetical protein
LLAPGDSQGSCLSSTHVPPQGSAILYHFPAVSSNRLEEARMGRMRQRFQEKQRRRHNKKLNQSKSQSNSQSRSSSSNHHHGMSLGPGSDDDHNQPQQQQQQPSISSSTSSSPLRCFTLRLSGTGVDPGSCSLSSTSSSFAASSLPIHVDKVCLYL